MGYSINREKGGKGFYVLFEGRGVKKHRITRKSPDWQRLGFASCKTEEDARDLVKSLNKLEKATRLESKRRKIALELEEKGIKECAWLPPVLVADFESKLRAFRVPQRHWLTAKKLILKMDCSPPDWEERAFRFYDLCKEQAWSLDYVGTLRRALNAWGKFYCKHALRQGYSPIPFPSGTEYNAIRTAYEHYRPKKGQRRRNRPAGRLSFVMLEEHKDKFTPEEYRWLYVSIAFGLRPEEMNRSITDPGKHHVGKSRLHVYQWKFERTTLPERQRWKAIPYEIPEQQTALGYIREGKMQAPVSLRGLVDAAGRALTPYSGRKEFLPMLAKRLKGTDKSTISEWMGHRTVDTARRHYDDPESAAPGFDDEDDEAA